MRLIQVGRIRAPIQGLLGLVVVAGGLGSVIPACLITSVPEFEVPEGTLAKGSCMCAMCLDKPFCMDAAKTTTKIDDGTCLNDTAHPLMAVQTMSVADPANRSAPFFCVFDDGKSVNVESVGCSTDPTTHGAEANVNPCIDLPVNCIDPAIVTLECGKMPDPSEPSCPEGTVTGPERTKCAPPGQSAEGYEDAVEELITSCNSIWPQDLPTGDKAQRFCFLSCLDLVTSGPKPGVDCEDGGLYTCYAGCDPALFNSPEVTSSSLLVNIDPTQSHADMVIELSGSTFLPSVPVGGTIALDLGQDCWGPFPPGQTAMCTASLPFVNLKAPSAFTVAGIEVMDVSVLNPNPIHNDALTVRNESVLTLTSNQQLYVTADVAGNAAQTVFATSLPLIAAVDWDARTFDFFGFFDDPQGNATLSLVLHGTLPNLGPKADAGPTQTLECTSPAGAPATLSAGVSTDPDGSQDLASFVWSSTVNGVPWNIGGMVTTTPPVPIGTTHFGLAVADRSGVTSFASTSVVVQDTAPPAFGPLGLATSCLRPTDHKMHLFRLGHELSAPASDACDPAPFVRIINVVSNQPQNGGGSGSTATDVVFGSGAFCVRAERHGTKNSPRIYTVTLEVSDVHGNVSQENTQIIVPHNQNQCMTGDAAPAVNDDDPRCTTVALDP